DGLMSVFFFVVGLEIRREMHQGVLSDLKVATLPIVAAAGGVALPALLYLLANGDPATRRGWAIPTATDIAFAVGVLSLIGRSVPAALRMLLLTLAIIDDVVAILVIAFYYSGGVAAAGLLVIAAGVMAVLLLQWLGVRAALAYLLPGAVVWIGILLASVAAVRLKLCQLPEDVRWPQMALVGLLGGIGFTMSIFIANLAFEDSRLLVAAKLAVLVASTLAAALALVFGRLQAARGRG